VGEKAQSSAARTRSTADALNGRSRAKGPACVQSALELLRVRLPQASAVVFSDTDDVDEVNRALMHGARGYIPISVERDISRRSTNGSRRGSTQATSKLRNR